MVSAQAGPSSESGTAEGRITRRLFDEMAGYLYFLLPAAGWAKVTTIWCELEQERARLIRTSEADQSVSRRTL